MKSILKFSKCSLITFSLLFITSCNDGNNTKIKIENQSIMKTTEPKHIILINPFEVPKGTLEETIKYWESGRDFLKTQPGYVSTKLHQSIIDDARFQLINIAIWESPQEFKDATTKMHKKFGIPVEGLKANPSLYTVIRE